MWANWPDRVVEQMKLWEVGGFAFDALKDRKLRSILTILMVAIGATLVTSLNGMNAGFNVFINDQLGTLAPNVLIISPSLGLNRQFGPPPSNPATMNELTVQTLSRIPGVSDVVSGYSGTVKLTAAGKSQNVRIAGMDQTKFSLVTPNLKVMDGRIVFPTDQVGIALGYDLAFPTAENVAFAQVGQTIRAEATFVESGSGGEKTSIESRSFVVRGIFESTGNTINDRSAFVAPRAADTMLHRGGKFDNLLVVSQTTDLNDDIEIRIKEIYADKFQVASPRSIVRTIQQVLSGFQAFTLGIGAVSLIIAAVGIITTLYTSVMERTREIGTLKALGYNRRDILSLFSFESILIGVLGATLGLLGGFVMGRVLVLAVRFSPNSPKIDAVFLPQDLLGVWIIAVGLSTIAGLYPAWRASRLDPVVALRKE